MNHVNSNVEAFIKRIERSKILNKRNDSWQNAYNQGLDTAIDVIKNLTERNTKKETVS